VNVPAPDDRARSSTAYRISSVAGTSARTTLCAPSGSDSEPSGRPRRPERSLITAPTYISGTLTAISSIGSSSVTWGGRGRLTQRERAGGLERGVRRVDAVRLAVEERHPQVDHRAAGDQAALELACARPSPPRGCSCAGPRRPPPCPRTRNPSQRGERLDIDVADRVLPVAAGLFHVAAVALGRGGERLAQRHLDRLGVQLDAARAQPVEHHVGVRLAHRPEHQLVGLGVAVEPQRRVAGDQAGQVFREGVLVGAGLGDDRDRQQRLGHRPRRHQHRVVFAGERVAGLGAARLGDRADVAGHAVGHLAQGRAQRGVDVRHPLVGVVVGVAALGEAVAGDVQDLLGAERAGEDADERDAAHVPVDRRLDHLGDQRARPGRRSAAGGPSRPPR
jgi:hypothetical protein